MKWKLRDDTMKILKRTKMWLTFKLLNLVRDTIEEESEDGIDKEIEDALNETLIDFYEKNDLSEGERELINEFLEFAKDDLVPYLLRKLEIYLRESR